jgi:hypothetical protein
LNRVTYDDEEEEWFSASTVRQHPFHIPTADKPTDKAIKIHRKVADWANISGREIAVLADNRWQPRLVFYTSHFITAGGGVRFITSYLLILPVGHATITPNNLTGSDVDTDNSSKKTAVLYRFISNSCTPSPL